MSASTTECDELLELAYQGAAFDNAVFTALLEANPFPHSRDHVYSLRELSRVTGHHLQSLLHHHRQHTPGADTARVDDYLRCITTLGWNEFLTATISFAHAALYRLHRLREITSESIAPIIDTLIEHENARLSAALQILGTTDHAPLPAFAYPAPNTGTPLGRPHAA